MTLVVSVAAVLIVGQVRRQADSIVRATLPGLSHAGAANSTMAAGFHFTTLYLMSDNPAERAELLKNIESSSEQTTAALQAYGRVVSGPEDKELFTTCIQHRQDYRQIRQQMFALMENGQREKALAMYQSEVVPAYHKYSAAVEELFQFNRRNGEQQSISIMRVSSLTQWALSGFTILLFMGGFLIGTSRAP